MTILAFYQDRGAAVDAVDPAYKVLSFKVECGYGAKSDIKMQVGAMVALILAGSLTSGRTAKR